MLIILRDGILIFFFVANLPFEYQIGIDLFNYSIYPKLQDVLNISHILINVINFV